ncbi:MAG: hypothetical protein OS112_00735 [Methanoregula sp.]|nr:MAG: hypothetical protein OS112_00735 [Methanoregula sp.]
MAEDIRDLIEKINREGIRAAEKKAQEIEAAAKKEADDILAHARLEADRIIAAAQDRIGREDEKEKVRLAQAGRDMLLSLRKEITSMLESIMVWEIRQALTPEAIFNLISGAAKQYGAGEIRDITVFLNKEDLDALEKHFLHKLKEETKKNIILRSSEEISGGFTISFDDGKSCYDFSDKALAEYIGTYLKPKLNKTLQEAIKG